MPLTYNLYSQTKEDKHEKMNSIDACLVSAQVNLYLKVLYAII